MCKSDWISVKVRFPEPYVDVLVTNGNCVLVGCLSHIHTWNSFDWGEMQELQNITHWMPLPKPPRKE